MHIQNESHLTYCTNIHPGESWSEIFHNLQTHTLKIKQALSPDRPFGIGLRLSNASSLELETENTLQAFKTWLDENGCYVFTINGFPYGGFHNQVIKDRVHAPDWTTRERLDYTKRLANILAFLLPEGMKGGISTSPLSYRWWYEPSEYDRIKFVATDFLMQLILFLDKLKDDTGKSIHIDMEPEPDGMLETGQEFIDFYQDYLLGDQLFTLVKSLNISDEEAKRKVKDHLQLCFDVCHFAVEYENVEETLEKYEELNIPIGKVQISAALKAMLDNSQSRTIVQQDLAQFVEPSYLHQAVLRNVSGGLKRHRDLDTALMVMGDPTFKELRTHYHVPIFTESYGVLSSTRDDIEAVLKYWKIKPFCKHLEVETYTWNVLPTGLKKNIDDSITRELSWVINEIA